MIKEYIIKIWLNIRQTKFISFFLKNTVIACKVPMIFVPFKYKKKCVR